MMKSNVEAYLQAMINDTGTDGLPTPKSRIGKLLYVLCGKLGLIQSAVGTVESRLSSAEIVANTRSDWFENDPTKPGYIGNRTHYTEYVIRPDSEIVYHNVRAGRTYTLRAKASNKIEDGAVFFGFIDNVLVCSKPIGGYAGTRLDTEVINFIGDYTNSYTEHKSPMMDRKTKELVMNSTFAPRTDLISFRCGYAYPTGNVKQLDEKYIPDTIQRVGSDVIVPSSTEGSTKKFKITVDDAGTITATEVTEE